MTMQAEPLLAHLVGILVRDDVEAYLVGGSVRDMLLEWPIKDYDFAVAGDALALARRVADEIGGAYVPLDVDRNVGRVVVHRRDVAGETGLNAAARSPVHVDLAGLRGPSIGADLRDRDFTINAMAVDVRHLDEDPLPILDPTGGRSDLEARIVRAVAETSLRDDPVRLIRAVRVAGQIGGEIEAGTQDWIRRDAALLSRSSPERIRDELVRMLSIPRSGWMFRLLDDFDLLAKVLPEVAPMHGVGQSAPHVYDVFNHSLLAVAEAERIAAAVFAADADLLGPLAEYANTLAAYLDEAPIGGRSIATLLELTALFHDTGKPATRTVEPEGRIRFLGHPEISASLAREAMQRLKFGTREIQTVETAVRHHMRPLLLGDAGQVSRRAVYRFFRDTGSTGLLILLLSLADFRGTRGPTLTVDAWRQRLDVVKVFLDRYFAQHAEVVAPPKLIDGHDLASVFGLAPGPLYRTLLEAVREAQAEGIIANRGEALNLVEGLLTDPRALEAVAASQTAEPPGQADGQTI